MVNRARVCDRHLKWPLPAQTTLKMLQRKVLAAFLPMKWPLWMSARERFELDASNVELLSLVEIVCH